MKQKPFDANKWGVFTQIRDTLKGDYIGDIYIYIYILGLEFLSKVGMGGDIYVYIYIYIYIYWV